MVSNPGQLAGAQAGLSELRSRLLFVLIALLVYRAGTHIPVPGINPERLAALLISSRAVSWIFSTCFLVVHWSA